MRGSEWRKWDLHLHSPGTKKSDGYKLKSGDIWDEYCRILKGSDVYAFGITDYFSAEGYFRTFAEFDKRSPGSGRVFFPNIELCTNDIVNKNHEHVNVHAIFDPQYPEKIREFLGRLETTKTDSKGRHMMASELSTGADYDGATTTRESIEKAIAETFGSKADRSDHVLLFSAVNNDGIRAARGVKRREVISDELDKLSDGFFGNSESTRYFLSTDRLEAGETTLAKPVISGSDAHSFDDMNQWLGKVVPRDGSIYKQCCWIKAHLTFEGLRQILFEPEGRIYIGEEPPVETRVRERPRRYLKTLRINAVPGYRKRVGSWFQDETIELNKELIAIIGNKGTGKSALTDILGLLGNSHNQKHGPKGEELFSFLNRDKFLKDGCASNFTAEALWYSAPSNKAQLDAMVETERPEQVEYLPQKYLEKICSNIDDDDFRHKLNEVIFEYVPPAERYGTRSVQDLVAFLTAQATEEIATATQELHIRNEEVVALERKRAPGHRKDLEGRLALKEAEVAANLKPPVAPRPSESDPAAAETTAAIQAADARIAELGEAIVLARRDEGSIGQRVEELRQARQAIQRQANALNALATTYKALFEREGLRFDDLVKVALEFSTLDQLVTQLEERLSAIKTALATEEDIDRHLKGAEADAARAASQLCERDRIRMERHTLADRLDQPNRDYQASLLREQEWQARQSALLGSEVDPAEGTLNWLRQELTRVTETYPGQLLEARQRRADASRVIFKKKKGLLSFYNNIKAEIDGEIVSFGADLQDYAIAIDAGLRIEPAFHEEFFNFVSQAARGSFYGAEDGKTRLKEIVQRVTNWQDESAVFGALDEIVRALDEDQRSDGGTGSRLRDIDNQLRKNRDPVVFYDYVFGLGYLQAKYDLKVDGKDLTALSAGERGGLLLIFYLMLDKRDIPLVIDQPEDNLDNKTVYEVLVKFLKRAKQRRQIIIATHNPNLAVVADAEQIIRVFIDKKNQNDFSFAAGAIEDQNINTMVVDILEGTYPAFDNRRLKYRRR